ncbi:MAG: CIA30 family protein [Candidatus Aminicenantales bacterium]
MTKKGRYILGFSLTMVFVSMLIGIYIFPSFNGNDQDSPLSTVIKNVRIFDGIQVIPQTTVVLQKTRIIAVGANALFPDTAEVIDGKGCTLLPGFFDAHVHVMGTQSLKQSLAFGITTVIDMFMNLQTMKSIKNMQSSGKANDMAHLISAGILVTAPKGHGTQYGLPIPTISRPEEAQQFVEARITEGSDFIKIVYDDGRAYGLSQPTLSKETLAAVIKATHQRGKLAVIHAATLQNCIEAMEAGVDGLVHLYFNNAFDPEFGRIAAQKKVFVIPTMSVLETVGGTSGASALVEDPHLSPYLSPLDIQRLKQSFPFKTGQEAYEAAEKALKQLKAENVPIIAGTDAPNPGTTYGASLHRELLLLVKAGLTPVEALRSATSIPAESFNLKDRGRIKPGLLADCFLVKGDPTRNIKATRNIVGIWKNGVKFDRQKYLAGVNKKKESIEKLKKAPPPEYSESGLISDFEGDKIAANFGAGWSISTDAMMGGKSTARYKLVKDGAQGSKGAMLITGSISPESSIRWAGALFSPGLRMMSPANLSSKRAVSFWAKGKGGKFAIMIFAQSLGFIPAIQNFVVGNEWKEYEFPFEKFGLEGYDIMGIFIGASEEAGEFSLQIDNVRLK